jgi:hypothetical protein
MNQWDLRPTRAGRGVRRSPRSQEHLQPGEHSLRVQDLGRRPRQPAASRTAVSATWPRYSALRIPTLGAARENP